MSSPQRDGDGHGRSTFYDAVRFLTVTGTLGVLVVLATYLVGRAWQRGFHPGIRSLASVMLPIIVGSFAFMFHRGSLARLRAVPTGLAALGGAAVGAAIMLTLRHLESFSGVPIPELLVASCLALLVFASGSLYGMAFGRRVRPEDDALSYYYGVVIGMLGYVILLGFPTLGG